MKTLYARKSLFAIEDGPEYVGYTTGELSNKFNDCPYFEKEVIEQIFTDIEHVVWGYNETQDYFTYHFLDNSVECVNDLPVVRGTYVETIEGTKHVYQLGAHAWIWADVSFFEKFILSASTSYFWKDDYIVCETTDWEIAQRWINNRMKEDKCLMVTVWQKNQHEEAKVLKKFYKEKKDVKKFYNFETLFGSFKDELIKFLNDNNIYHEISSCGNGWHFEIKCDENELRKCNDFITSVTITEE